MNYERIDWTTGTKVKEGYTIINGQEYQTVQPEYSGETPINVENLNHMDKGIEIANRKDIITIGISSDFTIPSTNTQTQITGFSILSQIGNKLSLSNNKIVIGEGIKKVLVSYTAKHLNGSNTTRSFSYLMYNDTNASQEGAFFAGTNNQITVSISPQLFSVSENDTFHLTVYGNQGNKIGGALNWRITTITVEVVEYDEEE